MAASVDFTRPNDYTRSGSERSQGKLVQDREWSWVGEDGIEYQGAQHQLESELSSERIPAYTLVSRMDWRDWLPAMQVAELQWALPPVLADSPRQPTPRSQGPKLPPPLDQYPSLRDRAVQLIRRSSPRAELPSRPAPSAPPPFAPAYNLHQYGEDDFDEPTVQIDAEQLERALNQSRGDEDFASQPGTSSRPPSSPSAPQQDTSLLHRMPTFPGHLPGHPGSQAPPPVAPMTQPNVAGGYSPQVRPGNLPNAFGGHEPTLASRVDSQVSSSDGRQFRRGRGKAVVLVTFAACAGLFAAWFLAPKREPSLVTSSPPSSATVLAPQAPPAEPQSLQCSADKHLQLSEFAHVQVPPIARQGENKRVAIGFGQTSRLAIGLAVDLPSISVERVFAESQSSPLWSVVPVPAGDLEFRTNRAASTLRSTTTIPTQPALAFGLSRDGLAVRGPDDAVDRLLWRTDWDTSTVPEVQPLNKDSYAVALRAGGERGQILLGKVSASGSPEGELQPLTGLDGRLDGPSLFVSDRHVYVSVAAGTGAHKDSLYIATSTPPDLPSRVRKVLTVEEGITSPRLASVGDGKLLLQYTLGATGHQRVLGLPLDEKLNPMGSAFDISPDGRDAYEGTVANHGGTLLSLFFVRHEHGHELWLARLRCALSATPNEPASSN